MSYGVKLRVWGEYACFTRPEMKVERVSYDVIDRIHVLNPIRFDNIRRNELAGKLPVGTIKKAMKDGCSPVEVFIEDNRQQRAAMVLRNVNFVIEAHFKFNSNEDNNPAKHKEIFDRRARKGQCFHRPYLGCREFAAHFELIEDGIIQSELIGKQDLGWMLHDMDFNDNMEAKFFRATMNDGTIDVPPFDGKEVKK